MNLKNKTYDELCDLEEEINEEMLIREIENPVGYVCCECSYKTLVGKNISSIDAFWDVHGHLQDVHGYPDEDARLGTERINR